MSFGSLRAIEVLSEDAEEGVLQCVAEVEVGPGGEVMKQDFEMPISPEGHVCPAVGSPLAARLWRYVPDFPRDCGHEIGEYGICVPCHAERDLALSGMDRYFEYWAYSEGEVFEAEVCGAMQGLRECAEHPGSLVGERWER